MKLPAKIFVQLTLLSIIFISCNKDEVDLTYTIEKVTDISEANFHQIFFLNEYTGFVVGGQRGNFGLIYKTNDGGQSWDLNYSADQSLFAINFLNDSVGYACGESLTVLKTFNQGISWEDYQFPYYPDYLYDVPFKKIDFTNDTTIYLTGGMYFDRGLIAKSSNRGSWWDWDYFDFELSSSHFFSHDYGIFCGYGHFMVTQDGANSFEVMDFNGDFFTSVYFLNDELGFASGYDGGIYTSNNAGNNWEISVNSNKLWKQRVHLNDIFMVNFEKGIAVGNSGIIILTYDGGNTWQKVNINEDFDCYSIYYFGNGVAWITCNEGKILKINI